jgi:phosphate-selective porin OprO and OprP
LKRLLKSESLALALMLAIPSIPAMAQVTLGTKEDKFVLKFGFDGQIDNRAFPGDHSPADQVVLRRARPTLSGTLLKYVDFYVRPDFGLGTTVLYDAYVDLRLPGTRLRVGKFKPPVGLERLQSDDDTNFIERGFPTLLVPSRDIGFQLSGDLLKGRVSYAAGVFNGVPDNSVSHTWESDHLDYDGRIFLTPFLNSTNALNGLALGIGASTGNVDGMALPSYKTFGQSSFFAFAAGVKSAGHRTRLAPQAYYYVGPLGLLAEYTLVQEGFQKGSVARVITFRAWQMQASYLLTGEKKGFATLTPRRPFDLKNHGWGAFEIAFRTGDFSVERGFFDQGFGGVATPQQAREWAGGVSWYMNRSLRVSLDYANTSFGGGAAAPDESRPSERALLQRFQINF